MQRAIIVLAALPLVRASAFVATFPAVATNRPKLSRVFDDDASCVNTLSDHLGSPPRQHRRRRGSHSTMSLNVSSGISGAAAVAMAPAMSVIAWSPAAMTALLLGASVVHALQGGVRGDLGETQESILGVPVEEATAEDVARLGKAKFMQLFYASVCPSEGDLDGEYRARTLEMGVLHPIASVITNRIWGPGRWLGKAIHPGTSEGYNLFSSSRAMVPSSAAASPGGAESRLPNGTRRERCFRFSLFSDSVFDRGESSTLDYGGDGKNGPLFGGMRDEIRKVNDHLYVGLGYIQAFGGKYNTAPFVLEGPPVQSYSGPDSN